ncbi:homoserine kinase [Robertkochia aurantiaca]|uniref:homoserine kinase n=1 Tax=Robertkochia aurantiaca TaxID=2873700 RepID=UPI001CC916F3|nr:homoserine kinase [Robertkochia sp. 3YJGBD-33]
MEKINIFCPATIANVSCGFDVLGLCLEQVGDIMTISKSSEPGIRIKRISGQDLPLQPDRNVAGIAAMALLECTGSEQGFEIEIEKRIKPGSGIGSSAASAAGAVFGINSLLGSPFSTSELIPFAMKGEELASGVPHADNVAPALLGGFSLVRSYDPLDVITLPVPDDLYVTVIHPQIELKTADSRAVLKKTVPLSHAIRQWGNLAGLVSGLYENDYDRIAASLQDVIIEPLRGPLIPGFSELKQIASEGGALGSGISGSGPSVFALSRGKKTAQAVAELMNVFYRKLDVAFEIHVSAISAKGTHII